MRSPEQKIPWRNLNLPVDSVIFFVCFYLYVWLFIKPSLIYHGFGTFIAYPAFSVDWEFLKSSLSYPGGMVEYVGGFLSQLYYFSWLGALIITVIAWLMYIATKNLVSFSAGQILKLICYIPPVLFLMIYNRYDSQLIAFLALLVVLWFSVAYEKIALRSSATRAVAFLGMFAMLYYIAGGVSFVFALLSTIYELFVGRRRVLGVLYLIVAISSYLFIRNFFDLEAEIIYLQLLLVKLKFDPWIRIIVFSTYFFFPLILLGTGLWQESIRKRNAVSRSKIRAEDKSTMARKPPLLRFCACTRVTAGASEAKRRGRLFQNKKIKWAIETMLPVVILAIGIFVSFDGTKKKLVQLDYFAHQRMWPEVLGTARGIQRNLYDIFCVHDINRALYYTGRLGDEMFYYPQNISALILSVPEMKKPSGRIFLKRSRLFLELGHIGISERDSFEYMELVGNTPFILEQIATIKLVKGQIEAAKVFLKALSKDLIFGNRGREMLERLEHDPELASDKWIQYIRSVASDKEIASFEFDADDFFHQLLYKNSNNKLAFEYMMAFYLLAGQVDKIVANIWRLNYLGYDRLPQHYEEAIVIYMGSGRTKMGLHGWQPRQETIQRAKAIDRIYKLHGGRQNEQSARKALAADFANSYFLYYIFGAPRARR